MGMEYKTNLDYDWRQMRRWYEITALLETASEQKSALKREMERTCKLLFAYGYKLGAGETTKADDLKIIRWAKRAPSVYSNMISTISKLNRLLEESLEKDALQSPGSGT